MAKYATRRSYKNRASKKRRTIRKLKRTLRRKIQRGGVGEDVIIKLMLQLAPQVIPVILSLINLGNVELLISIIKLLSGNQQSIRTSGMGGSKSNNRQLQRGGGLKENVLRKLNKLASKFESRPDVVDCINTIKARIEKESEPVATAPAAVDSSTELESFTTELTTHTDTNTNITDAEKGAVNMTSQDPELTRVLKVTPVAENTPVDTTLPRAVEEAAKMSIIHKMITFFNERIKSKITAKLDGMISNLRGKVGEENVIDCINTLKTAIVEDIVTQIKSNVSQISSRILSGIGGVAGDVFQFLVWSAVQMALGKYEAILTEGGKLAFTKLRNVLDAAAEQKDAVIGLGRKMASNVKEMLNNRVSGNNPVATIGTPPLSLTEQSQPSQPSQSAPEAQKKPGLLGKVGSRFGSVFGSK